jgi:hypothetical protein
MICKICEEMHYAKCVNNMQNNISKKYAKYAKYAATISICIICTPHFADQGTPVTSAPDLNAHSLFEGAAC